MTFYDKTYSAFLFDMDGTLLSSIAAAERVWGAWADRHGLDRATFIPTIHGVRAEDTIRRQNLADIDIEAEVEWVTQGELDDTDGIVAIDGIVDMLAALPADRWAIVTSATLDLALRRLAAAGITPPAVMVTGEDVKNGKPAPDGFLLGAQRLGVDASQCLIFEDAPAGILAAERAGGDVVVITATHQHPFATPHRAIADYRGLAISQEGARLTLIATAPR